MSNFSIKQFIKRNITWENIIFMAILISIIFYLFFQVVVLKTASPQVAVTTTSMVPAYQGYDLTQQGDSPRQYYDILRGDLLIVQNIDPHVGDVIVFNAPHQTTPIVHRIVAEKTENGIQYFATKGDHNGFTDAGDGRGNNFGWIERSSILGVVVYAVHYLGWFSLQLQDPFIRVILIVAVVGIIIATLYDSFNESPDKKKENSKVSIVEKKRKAYLKLFGKKLRINRSSYLTVFFLVLITTTYLGIGLVNYSSGHNTVSIIPSSTDEKAGIINLRSTNSESRPENYSNLLVYNFQIRINSSGTLNTVSRVEITPVFSNTSWTEANPTWVWTLVYDFSGSKLIHSALLFKLPDNTTTQAIPTTIVIKIHSSGLLASPVQTLYQNMTVLI